MLAGDAAVQRCWRTEERVEGLGWLRKLGLRVRFKLSGEEAVELAGFGWGLDFVEFEEVVGGVEEDFVLVAFVGVWLVEDAVEPHFKVFCGSEGVDERGLFFFVGGLVVWVGIGVVEVIEGRVFPFGLFLGVLVGGVFFQGGFFGAVVVALGLVGVQFVLVVVGGGRVGVPHFGGVLQSPIFFAVECVKESFSLLGGEFLAGFGGWVLPRGHHAFYDGSAFFVEARRVGADGVEVEFFFWGGVFVVGVSENERFSGMGSFGGGDKEQGCRENPKTVVSRERHFIHLVNEFSYLSRQKGFAFNLLREFFGIVKGFLFGSGLIFAVVFFFLGEWRS